MLPYIFTMALVLLPQEQKVEFKSVEHYRTQAECNKAREERHAVVVAKLARELPKQDYRLTSKCEDIFQRSGS